MWDQANRLIGVEEHDASDALLKKTTYFYDVFGRRIGKQVDVDADSDVDRGEWFVYDSQSKTDANGNPTDDVVLVFDDTGNLIRRYLYGPGVDQILAEDVVSSGATTETYWTFADHVGTIRDRVTYDPTTNLALWSTHSVFDSFGNLVGEYAMASGSPIAIAPPRRRTDLRLHRSRVRRRRRPHLLPRPVVRRFHRSLPLRRPDLRRPPEHLPLRRE